MNFPLVARLVAVLCLFIGISMAFPLAVSLHFDEAPGPLLWSLVITCVAGGAVWMWTRDVEDTHLSHRDGVTVVALGWATAGLAATLPYLFAGVVPTFTDAYFESVSGFTTTGASILTQVEGLPRGLLLWRAQTQWLGGMGIIVLSVAILPFLGVGGMQLYKAETPSPVVDKLTPRIADTAAALWKVYIFLTFLEVFLLVAGDMSVYDAVCHAFTTLPTGGFSTRNASVGAYGSAYIEYVIVLFMFLAGVSFSLHYRLATGNWRAFLGDPELRVYFWITVVLVLLVTADVAWSVYGGIGEAFRRALFQVVSVMTTTGYATADFNKWPVFSQLILFFCMFFGCMAGSTGGGLKIMRLILLARHAYLEIFRIIHPHATTVVKFGSQPVPQAIMRSVWGFFLLYLAIFVLAAAALTALGLDMVSALTAAATALGNVGPGLGSVGPMENFAAVPAAGKWILIVCMLLGRLEIYTILVLFMPAFWRK
ncbi:MAG TPA: potassium transporter TrkG [Syntrophales bacterium]|nr:potassium transporter TrkG [Syntrophales bacterium]HOM06532.1 potassium transporter TrkG [Syntrophales bacterium]HON99685.1 potassium transporter TrkG [Syntrophales bacterium]HPC00644.1 potassium transporter TrkG [Syntrophales bacterium]HPQ06206.1 potassium transporter TrkG [Syntrophales bacterium]